MKLPHDRGPRPAVQQQAAAVHGQCITVGVARFAHVKTGRYWRTRTGNGNAVDVRSACDPSPKGEESGLKELVDAGSNHDNNGGEKLIVSGNAVISGRKRLDRLQPSYGGPEIF